MGTATLDLAASSYMPTDHERGVLEDRRAEQKWSQELSTKDVESVRSLLCPPPWSKVYLPGDMRDLVAAMSKAAKDRGDEKTSTMVQILDFPVSLRYNQKYIDLYHCAVVFILSQPSDVAASKYVSTLSLIVYDRQTNRRAHYWVIDPHKSGDKETGHLIRYGLPSYKNDHHRIFLTELDLDSYHSTAAAKPYKDNTLVLAAKTGKIAIVTEKIDSAMRKQAQRMEKYNKANNSPKPAQEKKKKASLFSKKK